MGQALAAAGEHRRALWHLRQALQKAQLLAQAAGPCHGAPVTAAEAEAVAEATAAEDARGRTPALLQTCARCLLALGEEDEAAGELERLPPGSRGPWAWRTLGHLYRR